jgi:hypothetical protein
MASADTADPDIVAAAALVRLRSDGKAAADAAAPTTKRRRTAAGASSGGDGRSNSGDSGAGGGGAAGGCGAAGGLHDIYDAMVAALVAVAGPLGCAEMIHKTLVHARASSPATGARLAQRGKGRRLSAAVSAAVPAAQGCDDAVVGWPGCAEVVWRDATIYACLMEAVHSGRDSSAGACCFCAISVDLVVELLSPHRPKVVQDVAS